jgi:hypothetical protein
MCALPNVPGIYNYGSIVKKNRSYTAAYFCTHAAACLNCNSEAREESMAEVVYRNMPGSKISARILRGCEREPFEGDTNMVALGIKGEFVATQCAAYYSSRLNIQMFVKSKK